MSDRLGSRKKAIVQAGKNALQGPINKPRTTLKYCSVPFYHPVKNTHPKSTHAHKVLSLCKACYFLSVSKFNLSTCLYILIICSEKEEQPIFSLVHCHWGSGVTAASVNYSPLEQRHVCRLENQPRNSSAFQFSWFLVRHPLESLCHVYICCQRQLMAVSKYNLHVSVYRRGHMREMWIT